MERQQSLIYNLSNNNGPKPEVRCIKMVFWGQQEADSGKVRIKVSQFSFITIVDKEKYDLDANQKSENYSINI